MSSYGALLFAEKEGFESLFRKVRLAERYDLAIMSTKGTSNTAARHLVQELCGTYGVPLYILHDFDNTGFTICGTLSGGDTRRFKFTKAFKAVDLGLRLADAVARNLQSEKAPRLGKAAEDTLRRYGATEAEIGFLASGR